MPWRTIGEFFKMPGLWGTDDSRGKGRRNRDLVRSVVFFMEPSAQKVNRKMTLSSVWLAGERALVEYRGRGRHTGTNPQQVIWITASGREEASPWRQQANFRVERNPGGELGASKLKLARRSVPSHITALKAGHNAVSEASKRGLRTCR